MGVAEWVVFGGGNIDGDPAEWFDLCVIEESEDGFEIVGVKVVRVEFFAGVDVKWVLQYFSFE